MDALLNLYYGMDLKRIELKPKIFSGMPYLIILKKYDMPDIASIDKLNLLFESILVKKTSYQKKDMEI